ncbi:MAG: DEAD/DEAH box helicase [Gemmatimonadaceae bacterium]|nr:DEAD/DEAH box helicase [Gemmatimonadaceae bacterium]
MARGRGRVLVLAPAALREMWTAASGRTGVQATFWSLEALSRGARSPPASFIIVDEAHHAGRPATRRYRELAALAHHARMLLLTATPVRNRPAELRALLALFIGAEAECASDETVSRCVIGGVRPPGVTPRVVAHPPVTIRGARGIAQCLRQLPPPLALADGAAAAGLVRTGLARAWSSSVAALESALGRRMLRGGAILAALDAGRVPARSDLRAWVMGDGSLQLSLPLGMRLDDSASVAAARATIREHMKSVERLHATVRNSTAADTRRRAAILQEIIGRHPGRIIMAFTCFEFTALALFRALRQRPGVVLLTANGARSGAGPLPRAEIIAELGPRGAAPGPSRESRLMPISLVIATDLLAEGMNLQRASVVVHLDQPWTPSTREQREGRAARAGSAFDTVDVYRLREPPVIAALTAMDARHRYKARSAAVAGRPARAAGRTRAIVAGWDDALCHCATRSEPVRQPRGHDAAAPSPLASATDVRHAVAATMGSRDSFLAAVTVRGRKTLLAGRYRRGAWTVTDDPTRVLEVMESVALAELPPPLTASVKQAGAAIIRWGKRRAARGAAGLGRSGGSAERQLIADVDRAMRAVPASERAGIAERAARIRNALATSGGVAMSHRLARLHHLYEPGHALLVAVEAMIGRSGTPPYGSADRCEIEALLLIRAAPPAGQLPPRSPRPRPAASTETAAPR